MTNPHQTAYKAALTWYLDHGVDEALGNHAADKRRIVAGANIERSDMKLPHPVQTIGEAQAPASSAPIGRNDAREEALKRAVEAGSREALEKTIASFEGLSIKKTATNLVFSDGNPEARVMLVGEAPGADEDRQGKPFVGVSGQLLDVILVQIGLSREAEDPSSAVYISNILNWRPPGNRTPSPAEIEISLPFIEKHIQLIRPDLLILCGGVSAKSLLGRSEGISKLRKTWHDYLPQTPELQENAVPIPAIATYHPAYLLRTPSQKKAVWQDMLTVQKRRRE